MTSRLRRPPLRDPLVLEIAAAIGAGNIEIGPIHVEGEFVHGYTFKNGTVRIDPVASVVDSLVHELTHRLRPDWTERAVKCKTTQIMRQLSYKEIDKLYELVLVRAQKTKVELV